MKIIHLSYALPKPDYTSPELWLRRINFFVGVLEGLADYAEVEAFFHIRHRGTLIRNKVTCHFTNCNRWQLLFPFHLHRWVKRLRPDVVVVHGLIFSWQILLLKIQLGNVKIIAQHHAERPVSGLRNLLAGLADRYIHAYLFSSLEMGQLWVDKKIISHSTKIYEVMEGSSCFLPSSRPDRNATAGPVYLWVGRLDKNKNPMLVLNAFVKFIHQAKSARLYIIYQEAQLPEAVEEFFIQHPETVGAIQRVGKVEHDQIANWYNRTDFFISTSWYEGGSIALVEAMSCGCIPIVTDIPSTQSLKRNGVPGLFYDAGSVEGLAGKLAESLSIDISSSREAVLKKFREAYSFAALGQKIYSVAAGL
jgi:glycosyltransferase involved in cell wall biosynthesis